MSVQEVRRRGAATSDRTGRLTRKHSHATCTRDILLGGSASVFLYAESLDSALSSFTEVLSEGSPRPVQVQSPCGRSCAVLSSACL